jgi:hypothetical protein
VKQGEIFNQNAWTSRRVLSFEEARLAMLKNKQTGLG